MTTAIASETIQGLIDRVAEYAPEADLSALRRACDFVLAAAAPEEELVADAFEIARILVDFRVDATTVAAGLLHRVAGDDEAKIRKIGEHFGEDIRFLVDSTRRVSRMEFHATEEVQIENFRRMLLAMSRDVRVIMIRFADQLHAVRHLDGAPGPEKLRVARETLDIYAPLANRLGIGGLKIEFEDTAFRHLLPREYRELQKKVAARKKDQENYIQKVIEVVRGRLEEQKIQARIFGRVKHAYGIYQKLRRQNIPFEKVYDVMGIRIITETPGDCYTVLGLIHGMYTPVPGRLKDFIGAPKSNGYQSLQTTVIGPGGEKVEFQIRTHEMDQVAEQGVAAHWRYKEKEPLSEKDQRIFASLREMIQGYQDLQDSRDFLDSIKGDLFSHVVYVFTPNGDLRELPAGSTPVDFAYAVHSEVGNRCVGARVNGKIVPLRYTLQNGDTVEILTHAGHGPSRDWLKFVRTSKARNRIRAWIRTEERTRSVALGTELMERELRKNGLGPKAMRSPGMEEIIRHYGFQGLDDLLVAVGYGKLSARQVVHRLLPEEERREETVRHDRPRTGGRKDARGVRVTGVDGLLYHFSRCCYPLPGDEIAGFVTRGKGVAIHRADCPNLRLLTVDEDRLIEVEWESGGEETHPVSLRVVGRDKPGLLASVTAAFSAAKVNIRSLDSGTLRDMNAYFNFVVEVRSRAHLEELVRLLRQVPGVFSAERVGRG